MSWVGAVIGGAGVVGSIIGGRSQDKAANKALDAQKAAADQQAQITWDMFNKSREDMAPYRDVGTNALYEAFGYTPTTTTQYPPGTAPAGQTQVNRNVLGGVNAAVQPVAQAPQAAPTATPRPAGLSPLASAQQPTTALSIQLPGKGYSSRQFCF
jgi:hypothetical protein